MITADELERFTRQTLERLRRLSPFQRDELVTRILESDPELKETLPRILELYNGARRVRRVGGVRTIAAAIRRDGVM